MTTTDSTNMHVASPAAETRGRKATSTWVWMTLGCLLLAASGGVRAWQDYRFKTLLGAVEACPFPLKELPRTLGDEWSLQQGGETSLDPRIARVAGCTDALVRTYRNTTTGVSVTALLLFGPAKDVVGHTPEVCYPSAGYQMVASPSSRTVTMGQGPAADFSASVYARDRERGLSTEEVYYSFRHGKRWSSDALRYWKDFRHHPSVFKVQVSRSVSSASETGRHDVTNPTEQFLGLLMPEIERRIAQAETSREG